MNQSLVEVDSVYSQVVADDRLEKTLSSNLKILVIDDNEQTTTMLSKFFKAKGFQTTSTNDPEEGLGLIRNEKFDVILLDVMMPVISGIGIIELLSGEDSLKDQNIFIFTGAGLSSIQIKNLLRRDGVNGFIKKPVNLNDLLITITRSGRFP